MTAFLYISSDRGAGLARRVDFGNIASLFAESDAPSRESRARALLRIAAALLFVLLAIGDTVLLGPPDAMGPSGAGSRQTLVAPGRHLNL